MGADIHGWVEVKKAWFREGTDDRWEGVVKIDALGYFGYDAFGCLFGMRNYAHFRPLAAGRGLPPALSEEAERDAADWRDNDLNGNLLEPTWIAWSELHAMD